MEYGKLFGRYKQHKLHGRYISLNDIEPLLQNNPALGVKTVGYSVAKKPIYSCEIGTGKIKILMWSQMHGNESTCTKALFDFFNFLGSKTDDSEKLLDQFTFHIIPILNPDGAAHYTRENANNVDLNRDFCDLTQPESQLLLELFKSIKPDFCYNLHDQRTIYGAGYSGKPATISFLAPSYNDAREINNSRAKAIDVIAAMNETLQTFIPGQVGRFDDSFNINCVGDTFQYYNVPTILFEAGHYPEDYDREESRKLIFIALLSGLKFINENVIVNNRIPDYLHIPQNKINFYDFVYKNVKINYDGNEIITNFAAQYEEILVGGKISFEAHIAEIGNLENVYGHTEYDAGQELYSDDLANKPIVDQKANFHIGNVKFTNGSRLIPQ